MQETRGLISRYVAVLAGVAVSDKLLNISLHLRPVISRSQEVVGLVLARVGCRDLVVSLLNQVCREVVYLWYH